MRRFPPEKGSSGSPFKVLEGRASNGTVSGKSKNALKLASDLMPTDDSFFLLDILALLDLTSVADSSTRSLRRNKASFLYTLGVSHQSIDNGCCSLLKSLSENLPDSLDLSLLGVTDMLVLSFFGVTDMLLR